MTVINLRRTFGPDGVQLLRAETVDLETGIMTAVDGAGSTIETVQLGQAELDALTAEEEQRARRLRLDQAAATLRAWAVDADATTVTAGNAVAVLGVVVDRLAVFFDRFADLLDERGH